MFHKYTEGVVRQTFNEKGELVRQIFISNYEVDWTNESDYPTPCPNDAWYHSFEMKQPE